MSDSNRGTMTEHLSMLQNHLALADEHVATGKKLVAKQRALLKELKRDGHDTEMAETLLAQFEETQALHIVDRNRIRAELAKVAVASR